jgi:hypothetical protein
MFKLGLTAAVTAAVSFAIAAATGLGAGEAKVISMKVGDITTLASDNFHCQAITKTQVACGAKLAPKSVQVYYAPHQLEVLQFMTATKADVLLNIKR